MEHEDIASAIRCPLKNVEANWPKVQACLDALGMANDHCYFAALATIAVETAHTFLPIHEFGSKEYFIEHYWKNERVRKRLGNRTPEDAWKYAGKGFIQTTGLDNYIDAERDLGIDLIDDPDDPNDDDDPNKLMIPDVAASEFARFFLRHKVYSAALREDWVGVRRIVNGGTNGLQDFLDCVSRLKEICPLLELDWKSPQA